jgi:hypothetical protein
MNRGKIAGLAALGVLGVGLLTGCGAGNKFTEPFNDAPRTGIQNGNAADIVTMPDGFSNLATKCDHGNRVYVAYHADSPYASVFVVPADPTCKNG